MSSAESGKSSRGTFPPLLNQDDSPPFGRCTKWSSDSPDSKSGPVQNCATFRALAPISTRKPSPRQVAKNWPLPRKTMAPGPGGLFAVRRDGVEPESGPTAELSVPQATAKAAATMAMSMGARNIGILDVVVAPLAVANGHSTEGL